MQLLPTTFSPPPDARITISGPYEPPLRVDTDIETVSTFLVNTTEVLTLLPFITICFVVQLVIARPGMDSRETAGYQGDQEFDSRLGKQ